MSYNDQRKIHGKLRHMQHPTGNRWGIGPMLVHWHVGRRLPSGNWVWKRFNRLRTAQRYSNAFGGYVYDCMSGMCYSRRDTYACPKHMACMPTAGGKRWNRRRKAATARVGHRGGF